MPIRVSAVEHEYAGRRVEVGEEFEADAKDVPILLGLGRIKPEDGERDCIGRPYATREMQPSSNRGYRRGRTT